MLQYLNRMLPCLKTICHKFKINRQVDSFLQEILKSKMAIYSPN